LIRTTFHILVFSATICAVAAPTTLLCDDDFSQRSAWQVPLYENTRRQVLAWIQAQEVAAAAKTRATQLWPEIEPAGAQPQLDRIAQTVAMLDDPARLLVEFCEQPRVSPTLPEFSVLKSEKVSPLIRNNLRLLYGRHLARERLYDEALLQLAGMSASDVVDPASLLFYQSVVYHRVLKKDEALASLEQLLSAGEHVPLRYRTVAELMKADIEPLEDESLDHIARRMHDVRRRLELGRAGKKVLAVEDGVIESLDKLIKKLEEQQQQQQSSGGGGGGSPAKDSQILGGTGPGNVTKKDIGDKTSWGDLPPKKRRQAMQQISKDYPPHYREIIEQYFKRLATENNDRRSP
jgi:hypothetical protein